jgi:hypothetical protein
MLYIVRLGGVLGENGGFSGGVDIYIVALDRNGWLQHFRNL